MAISVVNTLAYQFGAFGGTSGTVNTSGSNLLMVALTYYKAGGANLTDSKSNTWTQLTKYEDPGGNSAVVIYYSWGAPITDTAHTFTTTSQYGGIFLLAVNGARTATTPFDQQNGLVPYGPPPYTTAPVGNITPSVNGSVIITSVYQAAPGVGAPTTPSGFTSIGGWASNATGFASAAAYLIQATAATINPTWGVSAISNLAASGADFMPPVTTISTNGKFFFFFN